MRARDEDDLDHAMTRLADGDRAAFDPLFRALHPRALRLARAKLEGAAAADAAQSAMMKVFARATEFRAGSPVLPWFYAIVANEVRAIDRTGARNAKREHAAKLEDAERSVPSESASGDRDDPEALLLERELRAALDAAVESLDAPSAEAIAALLGRAPPPPIAAPAMRKRISRAYARLRVMLAGAYASGGAEEDNGGRDGE